MRVSSPILGLLVTTALVGCGTPSAPQPCVAEFPGEVCLDMTAAAGLTDLEDIIEVEVARTLQEVQPLIGATGLRILMIADPAGVIPEVGLGGYNPSTQEVQIFADPGWPNLEDVLRAELLPQLAHEIHHAMRRRMVGYGSTLFEAAVSEGLADHFSIDVSGRTPPPWATALSPDELDQWLPEVLSRTSGTYNHAEWFHGSGSIPRWTGYAVGFELVRLYLTRNPGQDAASLFGKPAAAFFPPAESTVASVVSRRMRANQEMELTNRGAKAQRALRGSSKRAALRSSFPGR